MNNMEVEDQIENKINDFFNWINHPIVQNYYIKDLQNWDGLCASLHIIKDLQRPKKEYYSLNSINYLEAIGIMQTIYIEQDCIQTLKLAIKEENENKFILNNYNKVRDIRNKVFGHPSEKKTNGIKTRHFFDIVDDKKQLIKHIYWGTANEIESNRFSICDMVSENSNTTFSYLGEIEADFKIKIKEIMSEYKIGFESLFSGSGYIFEKLLTKENDRIVIDTFFSVDEDITKAKDGLIERNIYNDFERQIEVLVFLSDKLKPLFYNQTYKDIEFYTYASTLSENIRKLSKELKKIDLVFG
jgi:hypothetical protein